MADDFGNQMVASYQVAITGVERTRSEVARLDQAIHSLRAQQYSSAAPASAAITAGSRDIFVTKFDDHMGRVQTKCQAAMLTAMTFGKEAQAQALRAATTPKGLSGRPSGRHGPGRDVTGAMIDAIIRNVEVYKASDTTFVTGFHGWSTDAREARFGYQEKGTVGHHRLSKVRRKVVKEYLAGQRTNGGVPAANSLGTAIVPTRELLKRELAKVKT